MDERRSQTRIRSLLSGTIKFNDAKSAMDCTVRNMSVSGALVAVPPDALMPRHFELRVPRHDEEYQAAIVWRRGGLAGLALTALEDMPAAKPRKAWLQGQRRTRQKPFSLGY